MSVVSALVSSALLRSARLRSGTRIVSGGVAALAVGALLATGVVLPAEAAVSTSVTLKLTITADGLPVPNAALTIFDAYDYGDGDGEYYYAGVGTTDAAGHVSMLGLEKGEEYVVQIHRPDYDAPFNTYKGGWVGSTLKKATAAKPAALSDDITDAGTFLMSATTSKAVELTLGGTIAGDVAAPDGSAFTQEFSATALRLGPDSSGNYFATGEESDGETYVREANVYVDARTGHYSLSGLRSGKYIIQIDQGESPQWSTKTFNVGQASIAEAGKTPLDFDGTTGTQNAALVEAGTVSGTVTFTPAIDVDAYPGQVELYSNLNATADAPGELYAAAQIAADGSYSFTGVAPGNYRIKFNQDNASSADPFYSEWYDNSATASGSAKVAVVAGAGAVANAEIGKGFSIGGTVTNAAGAPVSGISVYLFDPTDVEGEPLEQSTGDAGTYSFTQVKPGTYYVAFEDEAGVYPSRYYSTTIAGGTTLIHDAALLTLAEGAHTANLQFAPLASLDISVTSLTGKTVTDALVELVPVPAGHASLTETVPTEPVSGKKGVFRASDLTVGMKYAVHISSGEYDYPFAASAKKTAPVSIASVGSYPQYLGGSVTPEESTLVTIREGSHTLQATLAARTSVSGKVLNSKGKPVKDEVVTLYRFSGKTWDEANQTYSSSKGTYAFKDLAPGSYTASYGPLGSPTASDGTLLDAFVPDYSFLDNVNPYMGTFAGGATSAASAKAFHVGYGKPVVHNQKLVIGGRISGTVTDVKKKGIPEMLVTPHLLVGELGAWTGSIPYLANSAITSERGTYTIEGLPTGTYSLSFTSPFALIGFGADYETLFQDPTTDPTAPSYAVALNRTTAVKSATVLRTATEAASAHLTGTTSAPIAGGSLAVYLYNESGLVKSIPVDSDGSFEAQLQPGTYHYATVFSYPGELSGYIPSSGDITLTAGENTFEAPLPAEEPLRFTSAPAIDTTQTDVGTTYTVKADWNQRIVSQVSYQWRRNGTPIIGETAAAYTSRGTDVGATISVSVEVTNVLVGTQLQGETAVAGAVTPSATLSDTELPRVTSTTAAIPGVTLRASAGTWTVPGVSLAYEWLRNGETVVGTASTYKAGADDAGSSLSVRVTASRRGYTEATAGSATVTSNSVAVATLAAPVLKKAPKIGATAVDGGTLFTAASGTWSVSGLAYSYQWSYAGQPIVGATQPQYLLDPAVYDGKESLTVTITATGAGRADGVATVLARKGTAPTGAGTVVSITAPTLGSPTPATAGTKLTVSPGTWSAGTKLSYRWLRDGTVIPGVTGSAYRVVSRDYESQISVQVTGSAALLAKTTVETNEIEIALAKAPTAKTSPKITGTATVGKTLTATPGIWNVRALAFGYVWKSDGVVIPGEADNTLKLTAAQKGTTITVSVVAVKRGYANGEATSKATAAVK